MLHTVAKALSRRLEAVESHNVVAARYNIHWSTISRLWQRYQQSGSTNHRPSSGRPHLPKEQTSYSISNIL